MDAGAVKRTRAGVIGGFCRAATASTKPAWAASDGADGEDRGGRSESWWWLSRCDNPVPERSARGRNIPRAQDRPHLTCLRPQADTVAARQCPPPTKRAREQLNSFVTFVTFF